MTPPPVARFQVAHLQAGVALALALALHLGAFALRPQMAGSASSSGAGGVDLISIQPAGASMAELIESWERPPEVTPERAEVAAESVAEPPPALPMAVLAMPEIPPPITAHDSPALPPVVQQAAPAPPAQVPPLAASIRPRPRPEPDRTPAIDPTDNPKPSAPARPAQMAAGSGRGTAAGEGATGASATLSQAKADDLRARWGAEIRARIERRKAYPAAAGRASGRVTVRLSVSPAGKLLDVAVASSSGNAALDAAALRAVTAAGRFPKAPSGLADPGYNFTLPISFDR